MMINYYIAGILWGTSRLNEECLLIQNMDKSVMERLRNAIASQKKIFYVIEHDKITWRLKLAHSHPYVRWMIENGFTGKSNMQRSIPDLSNDDLLQFFRGYFIQHYTLDTCKLGGKYGHLRLRFYAAEPIVDRLNKFLADRIGTSLKKLQAHSRSKVTYTLYMLNKKEIKEATQLLWLN
jgi:hypothetical protein